MQEQGINYVNIKQLEQEKDIWEYEKPLIEKNEKMDFMFNGIRSLDREISCRQCSSCHGCR